MSKVTETTIVCDDCGADRTNNKTEREAFYVREFDEFRGYSSNVWYHFCHDCLPDVAELQSCHVNEDDRWQYDDVDIHLRKQSGVVSYVYWGIYSPYGGSHDSESYKGRDEITYSAPDDIHELVGLVEDAYREDNNE